MSGFVLDPREGPAYLFHGATVVIKASGEHTLGQLGVMESAYPPGLVVSGHVHAGEDEMFYLLSGELTGFCEDDSWTATPGSFVFVPRDRRHGFTVTSAGSATALVITGPSQLDRQRAAQGEPAPRRRSLRTRRAHADPTPYVDERTCVDLEERPQHQQR